MPVRVRKVERLTFGPATERFNEFDGGEVTIVEGDGGKVRVHVMTRTTTNLADALALVDEARAVLARKITGGRQ